jgi:hypothetical protein
LTISPHQSLEITSLSFRPIELLRWSNPGGTSHGGHVI